MRTWPAGPAGRCHTVAGHMQGSSGRWFRPSLPAGVACSTPLGARARFGVVDLAYLPDPSHQVVALAASNPAVKSAATRAVQRGARTPATGMSPASNDSEPGVARLMCGRYKVGASSGEPW
jgi:hypothetical protein